MKIEVLGMGCPKCRETRENVLAALAELGREAEVLEVKDPGEIADYGVMLTPAVAIDGEVRLVGKVPAVEEIKALLGG